MSSGCARGGLVWMSENFLAEGHRDGLPGVLLAPPSRRVFQGCVDVAPRDAA